MKITIILLVAFIVCLIIGLFGFKVSDNSGDPAAALIAGLFFIIDLCILAILVGRIVTKYFLI